MQSPFIAQILVYGHSLKSCAIAIVVLEQEPVKQWAAENGTTIEEIDSTQNADCKQAIMASMKELAKEKKLNSLEMPKDIYMSAEPFSVENEILTPTFKLRRFNGIKYF